MSQANRETAGSSRIDKPNQVNKLKCLMHMLEILLSCLVWTYFANTWNYSVATLIYLAIVFTLVYLFIIGQKKKLKVLLLNILYWILKAAQFCKLKFSDLKRHKFKSLLFYILLFNFFINLYIIHLAYNYFYFIIPKNQHYYTLLNSVKNLVLLDPFIKNELDRASSILACNQQEKESDGNHGFWHVFQNKRC